MDQDGLVGAGGLDEVLRRLAQTPLGRGQAQGLAHRAGQEGIDRGGTGPDAFLQPGQDHAIGAGQAGLDGPQNAQTRVGGPAGADGLLAQQSGGQGGEVGAADRAQRAAAVDQGRQQGGGGLAVGAGPGVLTRQGLDQGGQGAGGGVGGGCGCEGGQGLGGQGFQPGGQGAGAGQAGGLPLGQVFTAATGFGGLVEAGLDLGPVARTRAAQGVFLQRRGGVWQGGLAEVDPGQRVLDQAQQGLRLQRGLNEAGGEVDQNPCAHPRQGGAGRGVGDDIPARQPGLDAARQVEVGGDEGAGLAGGFQGLAHQQGDGGRGLFLGTDAESGQALQAFGDGVGGLSRLGGVGAQAGDLGAPVVGGLGRAQGLVDQALAGQTTRLDARFDGRLEPGPDLIARDVGALQQGLQRRLRVLVVDAVPDAVSQIKVEAGQDDHALGRAGHGGQNVGGGGDGAGGASGDDRLGRRARVPGLGQTTQQGSAAPGGIDKAEGLQSFRPGLDGEAEEAGAVLPVGGQILFGQPGDARQVGDFFKLAGIEEAAQGVGHFEGAQGFQARLELLDDHPRHLEAAGQGGDGGGQVQTEFAGGEGRLVLFQIAERTHLGQQDGAVAGQLAQRRGEGAGGAPVGQKDGGVGQGLGRLVAQPVEHPGGEVFEEGPPGGHGAPARPGPGERIETAPRRHQASAFSRASASSRA
ncbi:hypothetical protein D3C71_312100 [compost metagenome]